MSYSLKSYSLKSYSLARLLIVPLTALSLVGCAPIAPEPPPPAARLGRKDVPDFLKGTIWEQVDVTNIEPLRVSGFGLVVNLEGTGDTRAPNPVREYMIKVMQKHGFGSSVQPGFERLTPDLVLNDPLKRTAIVRVDGYIPPGARKNDYFDVQVSALENSNTTSLYRGVLYQTELSPRGGDAMNPTAADINPWARVSGPVFVNPIYAMGDAETSHERLSLRHGVVMGRGVAAEDRPIVLRLREAQPSIARLIERRIQERFQDSKIAFTKVTGATPEVHVNVPAKFGDDWERFIGIVTHLYFSPSSQFAVAKAEQLAKIAETQREQAPLLDISYCWEAMSPAILPKIRHLYQSDSPDVAFAAARAGAFLGDSSAEETLFAIARDSGNAFQLNAVRTLGQLPSSVRITTVLRDLLDTDQMLLRVEVYRAMLRTNDPLIYTRPVGDKFAVDIVPSKGPPIVYATRTGTPRIAIIGQRPQVSMPTFYLGMDRRLSIVSDDENRGLRLYYRSNPQSPEVSMHVPPDLAALVARLGGLGEPGANGGRFDLSYGDVVGVLQQLAKARQIVDPKPDAVEVAIFEMQTLPGIDDPILSAPTIGENEQRPTTRPTEVGAAADGQRPTR